MEKSIFQIPFKVAGRWWFYRRNQFRTGKNIKDFQRMNLEKLINYTSIHVPYYKRIFSEVGLSHGSFNINDFSRLPLLDKEIVRRNADELLSNCADKYGITKDSTSGSTGTPLHFILSDDVQANKIAALLRSFSWAGYHPGMRTLSVQSYYFPDVAFKFNPFYNVLRFDSNHLNKESCLELVKKINELKPKIFIGFPFDMVMIGKFAEEAKLFINSPRAIITYGETLSDEKRLFLERCFRTRVFNFHSMHECSAMISQCEKGSLHLIEDFAYMEILDDKGKPSKEGNLVGTSFYNYSMPLIRYQVKDRVELSETRCSCGRYFRVVKKILGKQCDYIETPDGRFLGAVMSHSIDNAKGVVVSQCIQERIDKITVNLVVDHNYNRESEKALEMGLRKRLGQDIKLEFRIVTQLEKSKSGKTPFIISRIGNEFK
ncbi:MAG: hypothetical protein PHR06_02675 [Candidatus Cloacimonetes bacterium]|nr:hypothetical protein [Candidatus Cloacimonadota bacterium]